MILKNKYHTLKCIFAVSVLLTALNLQSQNRTIDSLRTLLQTTPADTARVNILCKLSAEQSGDTAIYYATRALEIAVKNSFSSGESRAHALLGRYYYFRENFATSLEHCIKALQLAISLKDNRLAGLTNLYIGYNHSNNEPKTALEYYQNCIYYSKISKDNRLQSYAYSAIGNLHEKLYDGKSALGFYILSLKIREKEGTRDEIISSLIETARAYHRLGYYKKSSELVNKATVMAEKEGQDFQNLVYLYQMSGFNYFDQLKDYKKALEYFLKSYQLICANNALSGNNYNAIKPLADCYNELGEYKEATKYYRMYFKLQQEELKKQDKKLFESQFQLKKETEKQKFLLKDSKINRQQIQLEKEKNLLFLAGAGLILLLALTFFFYRNYKQKQKMNRELDIKVRDRTVQLSDINIRLQEEINEKQSAQEKLKESEVKLTEINEELESFIYRASHDLKGPLASSRGLVNLALETGTYSGIHEYLKLVDSALGKLDNILINLQEITFIRQGELVIKGFDIVQIINESIANFNHYENFEKIKFSIDNQLTKLFYTDEILMQTILRNMLENSVKYSKRNNESYVKIHIKEEGNFNVIEIADNGIGISPEFHNKIFDVFFRANDVNKGSGLGLYIVKNAINKLKGRVELITSKPKVGTLFKLYFPSSYPAKLK